MFIYVLHCLLLDIYPYLHIFTYVYSCLPMFTPVYSSLPMFTHICDVAGENRPTGASLIIEQ